jgi:hypothetical protein
MGPLRGGVIYKRKWEGARTDLSTNTQKGKAPAPRT